MCVSDVILFPRCVSREKTSYNTYGHDIGVFREVRKSEEEDTAQARIVQPPRVVLQKRCSGVQTEILSMTYF